jgi:hypothetical protein
MSAMAVVHMAVKVCAVLKNMRTIAAATANATLQLS